MDSMLMFKVEKTCFLKIFVYIYVVMLSLSQRIERSGNSLPMGALPPPGLSFSMMMSLLESSFVFKMDLSSFVNVLVIMLIGDSVSS